jgi:hypothetical protein
MGPEFPPEATQSRAFFEIAHSPGEYILACHGLADEHSAGVGVLSIHLSFVVTSVKESPVEEFAGKGSVPRPDVPAPTATQNRAFFDVTQLPAG